MTLRAGFAALCLAIVAGLAPAEADAPAPPSIVIKNFMFTPNALTVKAGATVTWVNKDDEPHTVVSETGLFRSRGFDTGETFKYTFDKPGTYKIFCSLHPNMLATIVVE